MNLQQAKEYIQTATPTYAALAAGRDTFTMEEIISLLVGLTTDRWGWDLDNYSPGYTERIYKKGRIIGFSEGKRFAEEAMGRPEQDFGTRNIPGGAQHIIITTGLKPEGK